MKSSYFGDPNQLAATLGVAVLVFFALLAICGIMMIYIRKTHEMYRNIIDNITASSERHFKLLERTLEDNRDQINILRGLVEKTKTLHQQSDTAFRDLFKKLSSILESRCYVHLKNQLEKNDG